jgi:hypothetical protein
MHIFIHALKLFQNPLKPPQNGSSWKLQPEGAGVAVNSYRKKRVESFVGKPSEMQAGGESANILALLERVRVSIETANQSIDEANARISHAEQQIAIAQEALGKAIAEDNKEMADTFAVQIEGFRRNIETNQMIIAGAEQDLARLNTARDTYLR